MQDNNQIIWLGNVCPTRTRDNPNQGRVYDINGYAPTINIMSGGNRQPMVIVKIGEKYEDSMRRQNR